MLELQCSNSYPPPSPTPSSSTSVSTTSTPSKHHSLRDAKTQVRSTLTTSIRSPSATAPRATGLLVRATSLIQYSTPLTIPRFFFPRLFRPPTYTCQICYDDFDVDHDAAYDAYTLENCAHVFCKECLGQYVKAKVSGEGGVAISCFHIDPMEPTRHNYADPDEGEEGKMGCTAVFSERDIKTLLHSLADGSGGDVWEKYSRYKFDRENEAARRCPTCDVATINESAINENAADNGSKRVANPDMVCRSCNAEFCYYHSNSHVGKSCGEYERKMADETSLNQTYLEEHAKECPQCNMLVMKTGGCNQMKCVKCGVHFCWLCRKVVDSGTFPAHYQWWNVNGCPNLQMNQSIQPGKWELFWSKFLAILQIVVLGFPSLLITVVSSIVCCFCLPVVGDSATERLENCMSLWGNVLTVIIAVPVFLVGVLLVPLWCCLYFVFLYVGGTPSGEQALAIDEIELDV